MFAGNSADVPFALLYLIDADRRGARLAGAAGLEAGLSALREECARQKRPFDELSITLRAGLAKTYGVGNSDSRLLGAQMSGTFKPPR